MAKRRFVITGGPNSESMLTQHLGRAVLVRFDGNFAGLDCGAATSCYSLEVLVSGMEAESGSMPGELRYHWSITGYVGTKPFCGYYNAQKRIGHINYDDGQ